MVSNTLICKSTRSLVRLDSPSMVRLQWQLEAKLNQGTTPAVGRRSSMLFF